MARKIDAKKGDARAPSQAKVQGGKREGDAGFPVKNVRKVAVARVIIIFPISQEALLFKKVPVDLFQPFGLGVESGCPAAYLHRHFLDEGKIFPGVQPW